MQCIIAEEQKLYLTCHYPKSCLCNTTASFIGSAYSYL